MAKGDTKTNQYLDIAANGTRADLPTDTCCETRSQTLIREVAERIMDVEDEVEEIKNNPDVVDIVPTYAALQNYDTSGLTDKDIIRVLQDETHDGDSTYYRYNAQSSTWTYVGESKQYEDFVGTDGTTAGEAGLVPAPATTDAGKFLSASGLWKEVAGGGGAIVLTAADYNYPADNPTSVALWLLEPGVYTWDNGVNVQLNTNNRAKKGISIVSSPENDKVSILNIPAKDEVMWFSTVTQSNGQQTRQFSIEGAVNYLTDTSGTAPLAANQGRVLKSQIGNLANLTTTDKTNLVAAINEAVSGGGGVTELTSADYNWPIANPDGVALWLLEPGMYYAEGVQVYMSGDQIGDITDHGTFIVGADSSSTNPAKLILYYNQQIPAAYLISTTISSGNRSSKNSLLSPTVVQATGTSTTNVMSQNAVTSMVYADPSTRMKVQIGSSSAASGINSNAIGIGAKATASYTTAMGAGAEARGQGSVALGDGAFAATAGTVVISTNNSAKGYNNSNYRLLTGLYDPQSAHDAATKGYVDGLISALEARIAALEGN